MESARKKEGGRGWGLTDSKLVNTGGVRAQRNIQAVARGVTVAVTDLACDARELLQTEPYACLNLEMALAHALRVAVMPMVDPAVSGGHTSERVRESSRENRRR
jgi:hypothetical protein